jgi:hypothetical protein
MDDESSLSIGTRSLKEEKPLHSPVTEQNRNAYTPDEIQNMIIQLKKSGELDKKLRDFDENQPKPEIGGINKL